MMVAVVAASYVNIQHLLKRNHHYYYYFYYYLKKNLIVTSKGCKNRWTSICNVHMFSYNNISIASSTAVQ